VRLGLSVSSSLSSPDPKDAARWMVERAAAAAAAGLDHLTLGDHHGTGPGSYHQNTPMLGRLLAEWDERPAGCLFLVPLWNPVLAAEQIGTLSAIARGPFIVQTGLGHGREQFDAMGVPERGLGARLEAGILAMQRLLAGEGVDLPELGVRSPGVAPRPREALRWWIGGHVDVALDRAARLGDTWYAGPGLTADQVARMAGRFQEARAEHGREPGDVAVRQDVIVTADGSHAHDLADDAIARGYRGMQRHQVVAGSVDDVVEALLPFAEAGATDVVARCMSVPQAVALETVALLGEVRHRLAA
jgi:alkanesulfonate monooxygenase SsuD/methylene tetrahydromethanopterin reductase-like flavin-dependent oxidoreductase (luciferase family)